MRSGPRGCGGGPPNELMLPADAAGLAAPAMLMPAAPWRWASGGSDRGRPTAALPAAVLEVSILSELLEPHARPPTKLELLGRLSLLLLLLLLLWLLLWMLLWLLRLPELDPARSGSCMRRWRRRARFSVSAPRPSTLPWPPLPPSLACWDVTSASDEAALLRKGRARAPPVPCWSRAVACDIRVSSELEADALVAAGACGDMRAGAANRAAKRRMAEGRPAGCRGW
jgi:hypothetical protein